MPCCSAEQLNKREEEFVRMLRLVFPRKEAELCFCKELQIGSVFANSTL